MPSNRFERMTKAELVAELARLSRETPSSDLLQARCERDTSSAELEIQNRELRQAQRSLEDSRDLYADLYDFAPVAYANLNDAGVIVDLNLTAAQMLGRERRRFVGFPLITFVVREDIGKALRHLGDSVRGGEQPTRTELRLKRADGTELPVELLSRVAGAAGHATVRTAIIDRTDRHAASAERERRVREEARCLEAQEANATKDAFLATLSHELRTPLAAIHNWLHVMRKAPDDAALRARGLQVIENSVRAQLQLVEDLLDVSRIARGALQVDKRRVCLRVLTTETVAAFRAIAEQKRLKLDLNVPETLPIEVDGDPDRLQQILGNLLANAIKFTPAGGSVDVTVQCVAAAATAAGRALITVTDTGQGIAPEFMPCLFERFRQADTSSRRSHCGLGLGLSIAQHLAIAHGGTIHARSAGLGRGASFTVELPLRQPDLLPRTAPATSQPLPAGALRGVTVLAVDDDASARETVALCLEGCGATVATVAGAAEALTAIEQLKPHILLSDLAMPQTDGFDLIAKVRQLPPARGGATPAIALTAFAAPADRDKALKAGFDAYLSKPCAPEDLTAQVWRLAKSRLPPRRDDAADLGA